MHTLFFCSQAIASIFHAPSYSRIWSSKIKCDVEQEFRPRLRRLRDCDHDHNLPDLTTTVYYGTQTWTRKKRKRGKTLATIAHTVIIMRATQSHQPFNCNILSPSRTTILSDELNTITTTDPAVIDHLKNRMQTKTAPTRNKSKDLRNHNGRPR